ncbi:nucleotidyltransferase domain-containing protein [Candidatus Woesearchaeota archaeon]|nr:nucleotidyltransferase domain-containing protein [Candidatus Woesearchaeota archaeon]
MLTPDELQVLATFKAQPFRELAIRDVMRLSGKKSKPWVFNVLKKLVKKSFLIEERKANSNFYTLDLDTPQLIEHLLYIEANEPLHKEVQRLLRELVKEVPVKNFGLILFGSFANGTQTPDSDIDICFLIDKPETEKAIASSLNSIKLHHLRQIDEHYITFSDFVEMLVNKEENLGKQITKKHKLLYNCTLYYEILKKAYRRGWGRREVYWAGEA